MRNHGQLRMNNELRKYVDTFYIALITNMMKSNEIWNFIESCAKI